MTAVNKEPKKVEVPLSEKAEDGLGRVFYDKDGGARVKIVSTAPYPLTVPVMVKLGDAQTQVGKVILLPGTNLVKEEHWNAIRDLELIQKRFDEGWLRLGALQKRDKYDMSETNKARMIEDHCAKAKHEKFEVETVDHMTNLAKIQS